jgi:hypothetical protein
MTPEIAIDIGEEFRLIPKASGGARRGSKPPNRIEVAGTGELLARCWNGLNADHNLVMSQFEFLLSTPLRKFGSVSMTGVDSKPTDRAIF